MIRNSLQKILDWSVPRYCNWKARRDCLFFLDNARRNASVKTTPGFTIVGSLETPGSLGKVLRDLAAMLNAAGIPYQTYSTSPRRKVHDEDLLNITTPKREFCANRYSHVIEMFDSPFPAEELGLVRSTIAFWEFESGLLAARPELAKKNLLVGMSSFNANHFASICTPRQRAVSLRYPFRPQNAAPRPIPAVRRQYGLSADDFVVFFNFDYGSSYGRKNPDGAMRAFARAFPGTTNAKLVFKTQNAALYQDKAQRLANLARELGIADNFKTIDDYLPESAVYDLTNACDVYLSLHRGEGFGLGVAEAMSMGKAVVVTDYSATTEFCHVDNSCPIPFKLIPPAKELRDHGFLSQVDRWAEPDLAAAAQALRQLHGNPAFRIKIGRDAKKFIADYFSIENFRKSAVKVLESAPPDQ